MQFNSGLESLLDMPKESVSVIQRKLCIQPSSIKESVQKHSSSCSCTRRHSPNLIPRLPDDLVMACLIRVPRMEHRKLRLVCKAWNKLSAEDDFFYTLREKLGFAEEWIYVIKRKRKDSSMLSTQLTDFGYHSLLYQRNARNILTKILIVRF